MILHEIRFKVENCIRRRIIIHKYIINGFLMHDEDSKNNMLKKVFIPSDKGELI